MKTDEKPTIRCLAAKPIYGALGEVEMMQFIPHNAAPFAREAGWYVYADPADEAAVEAWEKAHPFNNPRLS